MLAILTTLHLEKLDKKLLQGNLEPTSPIQQFEMNFLKNLHAHFIACACFLVT